MDSTKRNILYNGVSTAFSKIVRIADQLLLVPFFLSIWGSGYYGEWLTLSAIPSMFAFIDFGFGTATGNAFVLNYASGEKQQSADYYKTGVRLVSYSIILGIFLTILVMFIAWAFGWLNKSLIEPSDAVLSIVFLMSSRFVTFFVQIYEAFYRAKRRAALSINLLTIEGLLRIGAGIIVLLLGYKVVAYSFWQFVSVTVFIIGYALFGRGMVKDLPKGKWSKAIALETVKKGMGFLAYPLGQSLYYQGSTFIVRIILGAEAVVIFNTVRTACRSINQLFIVVSQAIFPEMQVAIGEKKYDKARLIYVKAIRLVSVVAVIGIIFLLLFGQSIYNWWTNNMLEVPNLMWNIFMLGILFNAVWWTSETVYRSMNRPYRFAIYIISTAIISLIISYILAYPLGLVGVGVGYVMLDIMMTFLAFPYACKLIGTNWRKVIIGKND